VNGDGNLDLAAASRVGVVSLLLGNGDGTFRPRVDIATSSSPYSVAIGDVNGDSKPDLVTASFDDVVTVLLGNGDGTFRPRVDYAVPGNPRDVAIADLNGDGKPDLVTAADFSAPVLLGNGDGTFGTSVSYGAGYGANSVAVGDVSGDGKPDIMVANTGVFTVSVLLGNGDGTFQTKTDYGADDNPSSVTLADVNGDGRADIVTANVIGNTASILLNSGSVQSTLRAALDLDPNVINPRSQGPWVTAFIEAAGFNITDIDLTSLRLAGSVPSADKFAKVGDHDADGIPDLMVKFSRPALAALLSPGVNAVHVTGSLVTGERFEGSDEIQVISPGYEGTAASVAPNPLNPAGVLTFRTSVPGPVVVKMFDPRGRLIRTLMESRFLAPGIHEVKIDGRGERGRPLASGVYFYRVEAANGAMTGRFAILK